MDGGASPAALTRGLGDSSRRVDDSASLLERALAGDAERRLWAGGQTPSVDGATAVSAITIFVVVEIGERCVDQLHSSLSGAPIRCGHVLLLYGVYSREPADRLAEIDWGRGFRATREHPGDLVAQRDQGVVQYFFFLIREFRHDRASIGGQGRDSNPGSERSCFGLESRLIHPPA